jgi:hypothetical protein
MRSAEELRVEIRRLREAMRKISDRTAKEALAKRALELSEQAEAAAKSRTNPEIRASVDRYRRMLAAGVDDETQKQIIQDLLREAEEMLEAGRRTG